MEGFAHCSTYSNKLLVKPTETSSNKLISSIMPNPRTNLKYISFCIGPACTRTDLHYINIRPLDFDNLRADTR